MELHYDYLQTLQQDGGITVRLPSDDLSPLALAQKNSPCRTYQLGKPMSAEQFQSLPRDLRRTYLQKLRSRGGSEEAVGRMLGVSRPTMRHLLQEYHVSLDQPDRRAWSAFLRP